MGGDHAPQSVVAGAKDALSELPFVERLYLTGDESVIKAEMDRQGFSHPKVEIVHAPETVGMDEAAVQSVRRKKKSSISVAVDLVKNGDCEAIISAGNTGAAVACTSIKLRLCRLLLQPTSIRRPDFPFLAHVGHKQIP